MCMLDAKTSALVRETISTLVSKRRQFTGRTVFEALASPEIRYTSSEVSSHVRLLFNQHDPIFQGQYSCYPVGDGGPLLFFPTPYYAKRKALEWGFKVPK